MTHSDIARTSDSFCDRKRVKETSKSGMYWDVLGHEKRPSGPNHESLLLTTFVQLLSKGVQMGWRRGLNENHVDAKEIGDSNSHHDYSN